MSISANALRLTVHLSENDQYHHRPAYTELVHRAHAAGMAGATVIRGVEGYGFSSRIHTSRLLSLSEELPVLVLIVDRPDRVRAFLPQAEEVAGGKLITLDEVEVAGFPGHPQAPDAGRRERR